MNNSLFQALDFGSTLVVIITLLVSIGLCIKGILPVMIRLGMGLATRKIAILGKEESVGTIMHLLKGSKLFNKTNVTSINSLNDIGEMEGKTLHIVVWEDWSVEDVFKIAEKKENASSLIIFAKPGSIPNEILPKLDEFKHMIVSNFRGRLLNDILVSIMTTSYE